MCQMSHKLPNGSRLSILGCKEMSGKLMSELSSELPRTNQSLRNENLSIVLKIEINQPSNSSCFSIS